MSKNTHLPFLVAGHAWWLLNYWA